MRGRMLMNGSRLISWDWAFTIKVCKHSTQFSSIFRWKIKGNIYKCRFWILVWVDLMQATVDYLNIRTKFGIVRSLKLMISDDFSSIYDERMSDEMEFELNFDFVLRLWSCRSSKYYIAAHIITISSTCGIPHYCYWF